MGITLVLLAASALIGAAAGLGLKVFALVPIALLIALVSAAVLHMNGFGPRSGICHHYRVSGPEPGCLHSCSDFLSLGRPTFHIDHWTM